MGAPAQDLRIETARLRLRPPRLDDAVYVAEMANDLHVARMTTSVPHPYRLADAERFLSGLGRPEADGDRPLLIEHREFGPIGMTGFHRTPDARFVELGYWLGRTFRGRGFATEAVRGALRWAEAGWGKRAVLSSHFADNAASACVLEKAGFLYTGEVQRRFSLGRQQAVDARMMVRLA